MTYADWISMLEQGLSSALILEDDVDWDVFIKLQLRQFAAGSRFISSALSKQGHKKEPHAVSLNGGMPLPDSFDGNERDKPYGVGWDLLWLGHCGESFSLEDFDRFLIENDKTVPDFEHFVAWFDPQSWPEHTRFIGPSVGPTCTFGYALSKAGAQKILYELSVNGLPGLFDNSLSDMCRDKSMGMKCISVVPPLVVHHRGRGWAAADSDINHEDSQAGDDVRMIGSTENVVYSVRLNLERLIVGQEPISQWSPEIGASVIKHERIEPNTEEIVDL
jgi:hypothetical protein